jgi:hypothetical protein
MTKGRFNHHGGVGCEEVFPGCDYSDEEREFLQAIDRYKRKQRRPYPTWREVLTILRGLGWRRTPPISAAPPDATNPHARKRKGDRGG